MSLQRFLISVASVTIVSWAAWLTVLFYIDPELSGLVGIFVFYASLFFSLLGSFALLGLGVRVLIKRIRHRTTVTFRLVTPSIRQAIWFALLVIISLMLFSKNVFNLWSVGMLLIGLIVLEGFYLTKKQTPITRQTKAKDTV